MGSGESIDFDPFEFKRLMFYHNGATILEYCTNHHRLPTPHFLFPINKILAIIFSFFS